MKIYTIYYVRENGTLELVAQATNVTTVVHSLEQLNNSGECFYDEVIVDDGNVKRSGLAFMTNKKVYEGVALKVNEWGVTH